MATQTPTKPGPGPLAPPPEEFWEKYSPHYEFPLSSVGSVALHVAAVGVFALVLWLLAKLSFSDKVQPPMTAMVVNGGDDKTGDGSPGSGGGQPMEDIPFVVPMVPSRNIPEAALDKVKDEIKEWTPTIPQTDDAPKIDQLPIVPKLAEMNDYLRKQLLAGKGDKKGMGDQPGKGTNPEEGAGPGGKGKDPESSPSRAIRWELVFRTENGRDYLAQLAAMKATLVIPQPADWSTSKIYRNIGQDKPAGEEFDRSKLPGLYFVDDSKDSASKIARALGLNFDPPVFIAFFPKDVEEELAALERGWRKRKESDILSTKFKVLIRDGKYDIRVVEQIPVTK